MNYNELTPVQKHVVRAMHFTEMAKDLNKHHQRTYIETLFKKVFYRTDEFEGARLGLFYYRYLKNKAWIWKRAYQNECLRLAEIPKRIPGYTNERARREAKEVVDYVRAEYRRAK